jgi:spore germination cell wall hydrolase CwlJ-like protein
MSMIRKAVCALIVLSVLAFQSVSQAETPTVKQVGQPVTAGAVVKSANDKLDALVTSLANPVVNLKELQCLARNIFFEAGSEPEEGKVAVGLVTLNRVQDGRFASSVCGVVDQKVTRMIPKTEIVEKKTMFKVVKEERTVWSKLTICQFSWRCMLVKNPKSHDERWIESQRIAHELLVSEATYSDLRDKYDGALYFHNTSVRPTWARQKHAIGRIGGHWFYQEYPTAKQLSVAQVY